MDARRQKRLGPAPIASFEKSFEDNATTNAQQQQQQQQHQQEQKQQHQHQATMMEQSVRKQTAATTTTTTNRNRTAGGIEAPSIANANATSTAAAAASCPTSASASTSSSSSSSVSSATCSATIVQAKQRPPPLKTATTTVTTTLVSSSEGGQPLPPSVGGGTGGPGGGGGGGGHAGGPGASYRGAATLTTPSTPRIELSRASSSSHHEEDSRESSPENVFEQETIGLGFREEGALELRSSTEELYFMDPEQKKEEQERIQQQQQQAKRSSPHIFKFDDHQSYLQQHQRKDSASSEVAALLCISGRTSRISSVGSQGSAVSRLSAVSGVSRSPSPHRMLLETSFCGPKPMELVGTGGGGGGTGSSASTAASSTHSQAEGGMPGAGTVAANAALLEQLLLARKHDPTQAVLAEGIKVLPPAPGAATSSSSAAASRRSRQHNGEKEKPSPASTLTMGAQRRSTKSPGQMVVGKTASGTEYIRINLRPDHMYSDKGIAANERVVEAPNQLAPVYSKPASLSLQGGGGASAPLEDHHRLTPTASPKPGRRLNSRSPSPATGGGGGPVSRKSSFSSLFRLGKDSPDSPRDSARSRSKSKERPATASGCSTGGSGTGGGSQNVTPSKQKSVLAIFKPGKRGSQSSKSSSPIESNQMDAVPPPPPPAPGSHNRTPAGSRPGSRLRYYDEPVEGYIHIPLHTPPDEREARSLLQGIQQLAHAAQASMDPSPLPTHRAVVRGTEGQGQGQGGTPQGTQITAIQLAAAAAALRPVAQRTKVAQRPDLDAIQSLPSQEDPPGLGPGELQQIQAVQANWSLEVQRHTSSSQDSQETTAESVVSSVVSARAANLAQQRDQAVTSSSEMQRLPSVESTQSACEPRLVHTVATVNANPNPDLETAAAKERRRLLFATRLGSGSQEQLFSTQFSISKTESQSSQLSEQVDHSGGSTPATTSTSMVTGVGGVTMADGLQRQGTVIRRVEPVVPPPPPPRGVGICSSEEEQQEKHQEKQEKYQEKHQEKHQGTSQVVMRTKHKSRPSSEDEAPPPPADLRHSRYLENFDVRRKLHENLPDATEEAPAQAIIPRKPKRQSIPESSRRETPPSYSSGTVTPTTPTPTTAAQRPSPTSNTVAAPPPPPHPVAAELSSSSYRDAPTTSCYKDPLTSASATPTPTPTPDPMLISPPPERRHSQSTDEHEPVESSESERDSDMAASSSVTTAVPAGGDLAGSKRHHHNFPRNVCVIEEHESTGLVSQESFDDELPYIPTTLPEERAQGVPLIPMRERANMELKTCPVDRPRSTTPLNPSHLEEYCTGIMMPQEEMDGLGAGTGAGTIMSAALGNGAAGGGGGVGGGIVGPGGPPVRGEKLRISLPRKESLGKERIQSSKSPRRVSNASGKSWFEFAEEGLRANNNLERKDSAKQLLPVVTPPPQVQNQSPRTPSANLEEPKPKASTQRKLSGHWIDFENIPEKRKPAKRITTLPKETLASSNSNRSDVTGVAATTSSSSACGSHHRSGSGHHHHHHHHQNQQQQHQHQHQSKTTTEGGDKLHYNYVKPEDCQCECHEAERVESGAGDTSTGTGTGTETGPSTGTGTGSESLASVELLQHGEDMLPLLEPEATQADGRIYGDEDQMAVHHSGNNKGGVINRHDEFPRRDTGSSPRTRKFPDRK
ncbi:pneumococcal serine-rich repeat protein isoform X2 [Drosophila kikkawai]|uniref:Pneumococcal serine-rich repeat protein isoform X2 n=1 Tax=Drosophila kikkawai TaxID=30033 RepID=A0ABM3C575_DROKI|nr:mucin-5AC isoform X2 [Drosophila kikkawai]